MQVRLKKRQKKGARPMHKEGSKAPDFELPADDGYVVKLSRLKGKTVVVYFYPKDDTSGCTREAKDFSDLAAEFAGAGAEVYGISPDSVKSHDKFRCKHGLEVRLLSDEEKTAATAYGVWVEKSMYGKKYMGVERSTFLIDGKGKLAKIWRKVSVPDHAAEVLEAVKSLHA
jgi:peroxiredoxin Q/BCP